MKRNISKVVAMVVCGVMLLTSCGQKGSDEKAGTPSTEKETSVSTEDVGKDEDTVADDNGDDNGLYTPIGEFPITNEKLELTVFSQQVASIVDLETNKFTEWLEDYTNIHINWELTTQDAVETNLNLLLASGQYPDVFLSVGIKAEQEDLYGGENKVFIPLNSYIDTVMPNFQETCQLYPNLINNLTAMDGNIYTLPSLTEYTHTKYAQKMWVNADWLDKLGLEKPTTTDQFYEMLKAFKDNDPNGNGIADEVPLSGVPNTGGGWHSGVDNFIMNAFIYDSGYYNSEIREYVNDGVVDVACNKDEYREGLRYLNKLYTEGLMDPQSFTQNNDMLKQLALNPDGVILGAAPSGHPAMFLDIVTDPERYAQYEAIGPLEGPDGFRVATRWDDFAEYGVFAISTQCEYPEAAARWADAFFDYDVQMRRNWGPEGEAYREANADELGLDGKPALYKTLRPFDEQAQNESWAWLGIEYTPGELMAGMTVTPADVDLKSSDGFEKMLLLTTEELYMPYETDKYLSLPQNLRYNEDDAEERYMIRIDIEDLAKQYRVGFITGEKDIETEWDEFIEGLDNLGLARYLELVNNAYQSTKAN